MRYYEPFVKPLLDQPGSTYRHTKLVGAHAREYWDNYRKLLDDQDLVPDRPGLMPDDPKLREIDTSILLTGNLWRKYPIQHIARYVDHSTLLMQHMTYAALTNEIFQRSGLVRMLWWAPDSVKAPMFPTNVRGKKSFDLALTMGASINEVAGVSRMETAVRASKTETLRIPEMDASILGRVERRMAENGMKVPEGRKMPTIMEATKAEDDIHITDSVLATTCTTIDELNAAIEKHASWLEMMAVEFPKVKHGTKWPSKKVKNVATPSALSDQRVSDTIEKFVRYKQSVMAIESRPSNLDFNSSFIARLRAIMTLDVALRQINLEAEYAAVRDTNPDPDALAASRQALLKVDKASSDVIIASAGASKLVTIRVLIEDIVSAETHPSTMHRDRRAYEPLQAHPHEFWPQYEITLLDLVPNTADLSAPGIADRLEGTKVCQELLKHLFHSPKLNVHSALERLAPNAAQDLIPEVPAITDARKGGRLDPSKMPVRMLTQEMIDGLVRAFLEWPFRPTSVEMTLAQGEAGEGEGEEEVEIEDVV